MTVAFPILTFSEKKSPISTELSTYDICVISTDSKIILAVFLTLLYNISFTSPYYSHIPSAML